ncbi:MAG: TetR/AcrR family transcriptional regulator C-terminal domain-containing protein [Actinomycetota bacterium]|nr:TetR/AcrR family transcriptional regulator C-terminal domain-containing protein [Actinomycetota bacterium]
MTDTAPDQDPVARIPLTRQRVLVAAIQWADERGLESLSMRKLGQQLGVEAMSLYNHVANKDDMINGMIGIVIGEVSLANPAGEWREELRRTAQSVHDVYLAHPWVCDLVMKPVAITETRLRYMDSILGTLRAGGFSVRLTHHAYHALETHTLGFTMQQISFDFDREELDTVGREFLSTLPDGFAHLAEHVHYHLAPEEPDKSGFDFGLDLILDGLERMLNT